MKFPDISILMQVLGLLSICYTIAILYVALCSNSTSKKQFSDNSSNNYFLGKCDKVNKNSLYRIVFLMGMEQQLF